MCGITYWCNDKADELQDENIGFFYTTGRHYGIQMITMCHKTCHLSNKCREDTHTYVITTGNSSSLLDEIEFS